MAVEKLALGAPADGVEAQQDLLQQFRRVERVLLLLVVPVGVLNDVIQVGEDGKVRVLHGGEVRAVIQPPPGVEPLQHQLDGVDVPVREVLIGAECVLEEGDVLGQPGVLTEGGGGLGIVLAIHIPQLRLQQINAVLAEVDALVGLVSVKKEIHDMVNLMIVQKMREKRGLKTPDISRHLVFMGNPGTGKTTIARMMARIFSLLDILDSGHLVETDRSRIVSGQMGETAENMREIAESALGGVLFIDEAYALFSENEGDYGQEAIETLLKIMEDNRNNLIVIVAGYTDLMDKFLDSNPGLRSRFSKFLQFPDYSEMELLQIFELYCTQQDYRLAENLHPVIIDKIRSMKAINREHFGNARTIRNYFERVVSNQANRIVEEIGEGKSQTPDDLVVITLQDL